MNIRWTPDERAILAEMLTEVNQDDPLAAILEAQKVLPDDRHRPIKTKSHARTLIAELLNPPPEIKKAELESESEPKPKPKPEPEPAPALAPKYFDRFEDLIGRLEVVVPESEQRFGGLLDRLEAVIPKPIEIGLVASLNAFHGWFGEPDAAPKLTSFIKLLTEAIVRNTPLKEVK